MKILFAPWNAEAKDDYPYQNWYSPLKKLSSEIRIFDPRDFYLKYGKCKMNKMLLSEIEKFQPDYIFFTMIYDEFYIETFEKIKMVCPKTKIINFFSDDEWRFDSYTRYLSNFMDYSITTYPDAYKKTLSLGLNNFYLMIYSCNTDYFKKLNLKKKYDVSFIGQPASKERREVLKYLIKKGIKINIFGKGWEKLSDYNDFKDHHKEIPGSQVEIINQSKIMLNFLKDDYDRGIQIKGRLAEVAGCGTFQIVTDNNITKFLLKDKVEAAYFKNPEDLVKKINYYLKNEEEREEIALNSYNKIIKEYDWNKVFKKFFFNISKGSDKIKKLNEKKPKRAIVLFLDKIINIKPKDLSKMPGSMKEDYLIMLDKKSNLIEKYESFIDEGLKDNSVLISDMLIENDLLGEIEVIRTDKISSNKDLSQFPNDCFIFRKDFVLSNTKNLADFLLEKKINITRFGKISYPIIKSSRFNIRKNNSHLIDNRLEVSLYNYWSQKSFLRLFSLFTKSIVWIALKNNYFLLKAMSEDIKKRINMKKNLVR